MSETAGARLAQRPVGGMGGVGGVGGGEARVREADVPGLLCRCGVHDEHDAVAAQQCHERRYASEVRPVHRCALPAGMLALFACLICTLHMHLRSVQSIDVLLQQVCLICVPCVCLYVHGGGGAPRQAQVYGV